MLRPIFLGVAEPVQREDACLGIMRNEDWADD